MKNKSSSLILADTRCATLMLAGSNSSMTGLRGRFAEDEFSAPD